jgi:hypothetical protein
MWKVVSSYIAEVYPFKIVIDVFFGPGLSDYALDIPETIPAYSPSPDQKVYLY